MAIINDTILMANKAVNKIGALASQAKSYYSNPTMLGARNLASRLARAPGVKRNALIGAGVGAAAGAGYDYGTNRRSGVGSMLKAGIRGGIMGGIGGAGYTYGRGAVGFARSQGITAKGMMGSARSGMASAYGKAAGGWQNMVTGARLRNTPAYAMRNRMLGTGSSVGPFAMGA